jgi:hypothetical protein
MTMIGDGLQMLAEAIDRGAVAYKNKTRGQTILARDGPDEEVLAPIMSAIQSCREYQDVANTNVFALNTVATVSADLLARRALSRAEWKSSADAAAWVFRVLGTRKTTIFLKAAVWGISIDEEMGLSQSARLLQFDRLPPTYGKGAIVDRNKWQASRSVWYSDRHFDTPLVAYVQEMRDVPFMAGIELAFERVNAAARSAIEFCRLIEGVCVTHPLPMAYWLEFEDDELDLAFTGSLLTWSLPEVHPRIETVTKLNPTVVFEHYGLYRELSNEWRADLRRSMDRYTLSQCRRELIDRVLDLALAFEIAVSQKGDNLPVRWKVSVRTAQLIGGTVADRKVVRRSVGRLYELRNKATHGSNLVGAESDVVLDCMKIYPVLLQRLLRFSDRPDWSSIELDSPVGI